MKIKHKIITTDAEVDALFDPIMSCCLASYSSPEEQAQAILTAKQAFKAELDKYVHSAFKMGKKIKKSRTEEPSA